MKILYGTGNSAKLSAMKSRLESLNQKYNIELIGLKDLELDLGKVSGKHHQTAGQVPAAHRRAGQRGRLSADKSAGPMHGGRHSAADGGLAGPGGLPGAGR